MRKLLNTLYINQEDYYLSKDGNNIVVLSNQKEIARYPIHILDNIVCFTYTGASPWAIKLCNENNVNIAFLTPNGHMCGRFMGITNGNVLLRREQYRIAGDQRAVECAKHFIEAKIINSRKLYMGFLKDHRDKVDCEKIESLCENLKQSVLELKDVSDPDHIRGIEGDAARNYFQCFDELLLNSSKDFVFVIRSKRPPLNRVNALLSFLYGVLCHEVQSALESVGLDSYVGFLHTDRPGRAGLALDMMEELRAFLVDRLVVTLINRKQIAANHFEIKENGAVLLNDKGRATVLSAWQTRKQKIIKHPFLGEKIEIGLIPYVQAQLLSRYIRGDIDSYPPFIS